MKKDMNEPILPLAIPVGPVVPLAVPLAPAIPLAAPLAPIILSDDSDISIRQTFISKVYSVVWLQLVFTSVFIGICNQVKPVSDFMISQNGQALATISMMGLFIMIIMLFCSERLIKGPWACVYTSIFTILMTFMIGIVGVVYDSQTLLLGGLSTLGIFSGLTIYAWQTKYDYTQFGNYLLVALLGLIIFGMFSVFIPGHIGHIVYSSAGAVIFSFYIIYDTQLIIGGNNRRIQYSVDDYALASISLYLDVVNLFLTILELLDGR